MLLIHLSRRNPSRPGHDQWHRRRFLIRKALVFEAMGGVHVAVVAGENHQGVVAARRRAKSIQHASDFGIDPLRQPAVHPVVKAPIFRGPMRAHIVAEVVDLGERGRLI